MDPEGAAPSSTPNKQGLEARPPVSRDRNRQAGQPTGLQVLCSSHPRQARAVHMRAGALNGEVEPSSLQGSHREGAKVKATTRGAALWVV